MSETATLEREVASQEYAHSLDTLFRLGRIAVEGVPELPNQEQLTTLAYDDFATGVDEMLKTDEEFRSYLDVESIHKYAIINGQVCAADGTPMVEVIARGLANAKIKAQADPTMESQVVRDGGDQLNAVRVDKLEKGKTRFALSMDPKRELEAAPKLWQKRGYRFGIAYLQRYSRVDDDILDAGAYSIDLSDEDTWRELFEELGFPVAADTDPNTWIQNGFEIEMTAEEAHQFALRIRQRYYQKRQATHKRYSVTDYTDKHSQLLGQMFNTYYPALSKAIYSGENNSTIRSFAHELLKRSDEMKPEVRHGLMKITNSTAFDHEAGRLMDSMIRYAAVEQLRKGLNGLVRSEGMHSHYQPTISPEQMNQILASNVQAGTRAGRDYGGCLAQISFGKDSEDSNEHNPQDVFGGRNGEDGEDSNEACYYTHESCYCCAYEDDGKPRSTRMTVVAYRDAKGVAHCQRKGCEAYMNKDGTDYDIGNIAKKAQKYKQQRTLMLVHSITSSEAVE